MVLFRYVSILLALNFYTSMVFSSEDPLIFHEMKSKECFMILSKLDSMLIQGKEIIGKNRKVFVGESRTKYNPDDFYLWVNAFDFNKDNIKDLVAVDWRGSGGKKFYLEYYVISNKGEIFESRKSLEKYFLDINLQGRGGNGYKPLFPRDFYLMTSVGQKIHISFIGFHKLDYFTYDNKSMIYAENDLNDEKIIFDVYGQQYCWLDKS